MVVQGTGRQAGSFDLRVTAEGLTPTVTGIRVLAPPDQSGPQSDHPPIREYRNCAMRSAGWNRGVNIAGGTYKDSWDEAGKETYRVNTSRDAANDGHACEP